MNENKNISIELNWMEKLNIFRFININVVYDFYNVH